MDGKTLSLIDYLKQPNPRVNSNSSWEGTNTASTTNTYMVPRKIVEWKDFTHDTLQAIYGDILKVEILEQDLPDFGRHLPFHLLHIQDEDSLEALLVRWNNAVVSYALSMTPCHNNSSSEGYHPNEIHMARGGHAWIPNIPNKKSLRPDWAGITDHLTHQNEKTPRRKCYINILPGDSKLSTKWRSSRHPTDAEFKKPFSQLFKYCELANVRYGYLLTQEELVVVRVSRREQEEASDSDAPRRMSGRQVHKQLKKEQGAIHVPKDEMVGIYRVLEFKSIPWENEAGAAGDPLSINLALWCLHMMAAKERSIKASYGDLCEEYLTDHQKSMKIARRPWDPSARRGKDGPPKKKRQRAEESDDEERMEPRRKVTRSFDGRR
jgi:hypothetical protein